MVRGTVEIPLALHLAIILARRRIELQSHPVPGSELGVADIANRGTAAVAELDSLAHCQVGQNVCHLECLLRMHREGFVVVGGFVVISGASLFRLKLRFVTNWPDFLDVRVDAQQSRGRSVPEWQPRCRHLPPVHSYMDYLIAQIKSGFEVSTACPSYTTSHHMWDNRLHQSMTSTAPMIIGSFTIECLLRGCISYFLQG